MILYLKVGSVVLEMLLHTYTQLSNPLPLCLQGSSVGLGSEGIISIEANNSTANNTPVKLLLGTLPSVYRKDMKNGKKKYPYSINNNLMHSDMDVRVLSLITTF